MNFANEERYRRVKPTAEEMVEWFAKQKKAGTRPMTPLACRQYRLECKLCGTRIWGSGMGIGAHNRKHARERHAEATMDGVIDGVRREILRDRDPRFIAP